MKSEYGFMTLLKRFYWDMLDSDERKYYAYWLIWQVPGLFGNRLRAGYLSKKFKYAGEKLTVMAGARFRSMENLSVGNNVFIGYDCFIQALGGVSIGDNSATGPGSKLWSVNHNIKDKNRLIGEQGQTMAEIVIGNDVFVGSNAFILPGVHLPDGVVVTAGSVVNAKKYKPYSILAGHPARVIGYREDIDTSNEDDLL